MTVDGMEGVELGTVWSMNHTWQGRVRKSTLTSFGNCCIGIPDTSNHIGKSHLKERWLMLKIICPSRQTLTNWDFPPRDILARSSRRFKSRWLLQPHRAQQLPKVLEPLRQGATWFEFTQPFVWGMGRRENATQHVRRDPVSLYPM